MAETFYWNGTNDFNTQELTLTSVIISLFSDVFEKALNAGFIQATDYVEIWQSNLDYLRRRVDFSKGKNICFFFFCFITGMLLHSHVLAADIR